METRERRVGTKRGRSREGGRKREKKEKEKRGKRVGTRWRVEAPRMG